MKEAITLHQEVEKFKSWAETSNKHSGEWECNYEHWENIWEATSNVISIYKNGLIPDEVADQLLYAIARDNECERIRYQLLTAPSLIESLATRAILSLDSDAKWQIAISLEQAKTNNASALIRPFLTDEDEYVRRRSLLAFASLEPEEAEAIAVNNLTAESEYTRMAALHVLKITQSNHLEAALSLLSTDSDQYVRKHVEEIRKLT